MGSSVLRDATDMRLAAIALMAVWWLPGSALAEPMREPAAILIGEGQAVDGDGIVFGDVEVRLQGVAAPEWSRWGGFDPGGEEALRGLAALVDGREVRCHLDGTVASSNRPVGVCYVNGRDVGKFMIGAGLARDCPRFSDGRYAPDEARAQRRGLNLSEIYSLPGYCIPR